jgi:2-polyprenyl-6-hydroxyphenyl methylase / 3-demethylubiquinone-9 3-methyltransferase
MDSARREAETSRRTGAPGSGTLDDAELARFATLSAEWWDPKGKFRPLHQIGPVRLSFIRDRLVGHFRLAPRALKPLAGLKVLDIGCGGGLVSEPLARMGAAVTGIEPSEANLRAAVLHAEPQGLGIDYRVARVEDLAAAGESFDAVVCLEVIEHVPDVGAFLRTCAALVRPGGIMVLSTINRTLKSFALAIVGAEYILRWLPVGTHQWERFVTPDELRQHLAAAGMVLGHVEGMVYNPLSDRWSLARDTDVNYLAAGTHSH